MQNKINSFDYSSAGKIRLLPSISQIQLHETLDYYLQISNEDLLSGFRSRAGLPSLPTRLVGWYSTGIYHIFGQLLGALSKMYCVTGDERAKEKALELLDGWMECIEPDGYCLYNARGQVGDVCYEFEKLCGGFVDMYAYLKSEKALKALTCLCDWGASYLSSHSKIGEWYTVPENLFRAYQLTGNIKFKKLAESFLYTKFWDKFLECPSTLSKVHAYSHVNSLNSAVAAYRVSNNRRYLECAIAAVDLIVRNHTYATGMFGPAEELFADEGYLGESVLRPLVRETGCYGNSEVPCCSWAVLKLCRSLLEITGESKYADWAEKIMINGIGASLALKGNGLIPYYMYYHVFGAQKDYYFDHWAWYGGPLLQWTCCAGTYPQAVAEYANFIYWYNNDGLYISQFIPSELNCTIKGSSVNINILTSFPESEEVNINITSTTPVNFTMFLRLPDWANDFTLFIDNKTQSISKDPLGWIPVSQHWEGTKTITFKLAMALKWIPVDSVHQNIGAIQYGPVTLASDTPGVILQNPKCPAEWLKRTSKHQLKFISDENSIKCYPLMKKVFKPLANYQRGEKYFLYQITE